MSKLRPKFLRAALGSWNKTRRFKAQFRDFQERQGRLPPRFELKWEDRFPCLDDATPRTSFDRHYIYHTGWAARVLAQSRPNIHYDIGSSLYFVSLVSAFVPMKFFDYRPAALDLSGLQTGSADLSCLPFANGSVESLSCMHVVEHVGLGRYGDPIAPEGDKQAMKELGRVIAPRGSLLFVVPIGRPRIHFNAHRIYSYEQVVDAFSSLELVQFALIPEAEQDGGLRVDPPAELLQSQCYGCGCFWFKKKEVMRLGGNSG